MTCLSLVKAGVGRHRAARAHPLPGQQAGRRPGTGPRRRRQYAQSLPRGQGAKTRPSAASGATLGGPQLHWKTPLTDSLDERETEEKCEKSRSTPDPVTA